MALGNFFADFFTGSFMGFEPGGAPALAVHPLPGGGEVTFSLALRG